GPKEDEEEAPKWLNEAVERDPDFFQAYWLLALAHDQLYSSGLDHTPARLALAEAALKEGLHIRPNGAEAHHARAFHLYFAYGDFDGAMAELDIARRGLPNDPRIFSLLASIQRRQGHWEESIRNFERAIELDPRNLNRFFQAADTYEGLRRY